MYDVNKKFNFIQRLQMLLKTFSGVSNVFFEFEFQHFYTHDPIANSTHNQQLVA